MIRDGDHADSTVFGTYAGGEFWTGVTIATRYCDQDCGRPAPPAATTCPECGEAT